MAPSRRSLILIATRWGSHYGGINAFNLDLARALPQVARPDLSILCIVPDCTAEQIAEEARGGLRLIPFGSLYPDRLDWATFAACLPGELREVPVACIVGHDRHTGSLAVELARSAPHAESAVVLHASPGDYIRTKRSVAELSSRRQEQITVFSEADRAFAVGPLLTERLEELRSDVCELIPGIPWSEPTQQKHRLIVSISGRFDLEDEPLKNLRLAAATVVRAWAAAGGKEGPWARPLLLQLFGVNDAEADSIEQFLKAKSTRPGFSVEVHPFLTQRDLYLNFIRTSSLVIMPSLHEGFGLVAWEALGSGVPVILGENTGVFKLLQREFSPDSLRSIRSFTSTPADETLSTALTIAIADLVPRLDDAEESARRLRDQFLESNNWTWRSTARTFLNHLQLLPPSNTDSLGTLSGIPSSKHLSLPPLPRDPIALEVLETFDEGFKYLEHRFLAAQQQIDHAAFAPPLPQWKEVASDYANAVKNVVRENRVFYRYVGGLPLHTHPQHRLFGIQHLLKVTERLPQNRRYTPSGHFLLEREIGPNLCIFDRVELFLYLPSIPHSPGYAFVSRDLQIVSAFRSYFDSLWASAHLFPTLESVAEILEALPKLHSDLGQLLSSAGIR